MATWTTQTGAFAVVVALLLLLLTIKQLDAPSAGPVSNICVCSDSSGTPVQPCPTVPESPPSATKPVASSHERTSDLVALMPRPVGVDAASEGTLMWHVLHKTSLHRGVLLFSIATHQSVESTVNMLLSLHGAGIRANVPLILCLDIESFQYLSGLGGINAFLVGDNVWEEIGWSLQRTDRELDRFHQITRCKEPIVLFFLKRALNVFLLDNDLVFVRRKTNGIDAVINLLITLDSPVVQFATMMDNPPGKQFELQYNTGFFLARAGPVVLDIFERIVQRNKAIPITHDVDDQRIFNNYFMDGKPEDRQCVLELPWYLYMTGKLSSWKHPDECCQGTALYDGWASNWDIAHDDDLPFAFHFNMAINGKVSSMKTWRLWPFDNADLWKQAGLKHS